LYNKKKELYCGYGLQEGVESEYRDEITAGLIGEFLPGISSNPNILTSRIKLINRFKRLERLL